MLVKRIIVVAIAWIAFSHVHGSLIVTCDEAFLCGDNAGTYEVSTITGTFNDNADLLVSQPWWGDELFAMEMTRLTGSDLGLEPLFAWAFDDLAGLLLIATFYIPPTPDNPFPDVGTRFPSTSNINTYAVAARVPEPGTLGIMGAGLFALGFMRRKRAAQSAQETA